MFQRTWRRPYVPHVPRFYTERGSGPLVSAVDGHHRSQWLAAVYSDESLIIKMVCPHPAVRQAGPRRLWDRVEEAIACWRRVGRPNYDRFGITATATEQYVW